MNIPIWEYGSWEPLQSLSADGTADVCVIGLGGSGLAAVAELADQGVAVVGLDGGSVGCSAAGRNGGFILAGLAAFFHDLVARLGSPCAASLYRETVGEISRLKSEFPDLVDLTGSLRIAAEDDELGDCERHRLALRQHDFPVEGYDGREGRGLLIPTDGVFHPLKCVRRQAARLVAQGVRLFERTPVAAVASGQVTTTGGRISCQTVIAAVDGRLEQLFPALKPRLRTARLQMLATAPVSEISFLRPVYWRHGFEYWRQLSTGEVVLGGFRDQGGEREWTCDSNPSDSVQGLLGQFLRGHLNIRAPVTHRWAAPVAYTHDGLPVLEEVQPHVFALGGYSGTGNIVGRLCGRAAARLACGKESKWAEIVKAAHASFDLSKVHPRSLLL